MILRRVHRDGQVEYRHHKDVGATRWIEWTIDPTAATELPPEQAFVESLAEQCYSDEMSHIQVVVEVLHCEQFQRPANIDWELLP